MELDGLSKSLSIALRLISVPFSLMISKTSAACFSVQIGENSHLALALVKRTNRQLNCMYIKE
uniref:Uncharacterized protein n=1 Tax=Romanomermis culicivorax TaxID=13658 RepID=A0A915KU37_ROMCU